MESDGPTLKLLIRDGGVERLEQLGWLLIQIAL